MFLSQATVDSINAAQSDEERSKRMFVGFLTSALGADNIYAGTDNQVGNRSDQYIIANPDGTASALGQPVSNRQSIVAQDISPLTLLLVVAGLVWLVRH